jgi:hypothetical protein
MESPLITPIWTVSSMVSSEAGTRAVTSVPLTNRVAS